MMASKFMDRLLCKETCHGKRHRDAMISKTRHARSMQSSRSMNFEAIIHFSDLCAHNTQIMRDRGNAIGLFDAQLLCMPNDRCAICQSTCHREYRQLVNNLALLYLE